MSAPYTVRIEVKNAAGETMTELNQRLDDYASLVAYQKALTAGIFGMADEAVREKSGSATKPNR